MVRGRRGRVKNGTMSANGLSGPNPSLLAMSANGPKRTSAVRDYARLGRCQTLWNLPIGLRRN